MSFESEYKDLIIKQYWDKPNAVAEVAVLVDSIKKVFDLLSLFPIEFDIDEATGERLDIIGRMVDLRRDAVNPTLNDDDYRFLLRVKIANNTGSAFMVSDARSSIQDVINFAFNGEAFVVDNQDMTLTLYVADTVDLGLLANIVELGLLPKPQGVRYTLTVQYTDAETFGFSDNPHALSFGDKFDIDYNGGHFAEKVIL